MAEGHPTRQDETPADVPAEWRPLLRAIAPLIEAWGATLVDAGGRVLLGGGKQGSREVPLMWEGRLVGVVRLPDLHDALDRLVADVEQQLGRPLHELSREGKQRAVQLLDERGAFVLRKAVEDVADRLGVSRFTVYNYLARERPSE
jgi:hypothetical protein